MAILCAVLVVAVVTATNDYSKDEQFRALNAVKDDVNVQVSPTQPNPTRQSQSLLVCASLQISSKCQLLRAAPVCSTKSI